MRMQGFGEIPARQFVPFTEKHSRSYQANRAKWPLRFFQKLHSNAGDTLCFTNIPALFI